jgi:hypothetical protein
MEEEEEITIEDLLKPSPNQVVEGEEKEEEEKENQYDLTPITIESLMAARDKDLPVVNSIEPMPTVVRDNPGLRQSRLGVKLDDEGYPMQPLLSQAINYNLDEEFILGQTQNPEETKFYIETQEVTNEFEKIINNPVLKDYSTILPIQADALNLDFEDVQKIDVEATMNELSMAKINLPAIVAYDITAKSLIDGPNPLIDGPIPMFNYSENPKEDTTRFYTPTSEVKDYIRNSILTETGRDFKDTMTWEDFVAKASKVTDEIMKKDPLIKEIFGKANMVLKNEGQAKYIEMLNTAREENGLDTPEEIEALQSQYSDWEKKRWDELIQSTTFDNRAQKYQFATKNVLEELYKPFGRSKDESLAEIDRKLKSGEISETLWGLRDIGIGTWRGLPNKWNILDITAKKSTLNEFQSNINFYESNKEKLEKLGMLDLTNKEFEEKLRLAGFPQFKRKKKKINPALGYARLSTEQAAKLIKDLKKYDDDYPTTLEYENSLKHLTQEEKELMLETYTQFTDMQSSMSGFNALDASQGKNTLRNGMNRIIPRQEMILKSTIEPTIEILKNTNFQSLLNETDPDEDGIVDTVGQILSQSNMMLTFGGELTAMVGSKMKNPLGVVLYGSGKLASLIGTADIAAQEFGSGIWGTFDANIRKRKGENYQPTLDDYLAELEDPDSVSIIQNIISTGGIVALERLGLGKMLGATKMTSKNLASLLRGEYKTWLKTLPALVYQRELAGGIEFVTEGSQDYISSANIKFGSGDSLGQSISEAEFGMLAAKKGRQIGRFLPVVGQITKQTAIELNAAALKLSTNFDLGKYSQTFKSTELFFNQSIEKIQKDVDSNKISQEDGQLAIRNISNIRNAGMKIPTNIDGRSKPRLMRLLLEQQALQNKIKEIDNKDLSANDILQLATVSSQIQGIVKKADSRENYIKQVGNVVNIINNNENAKVKIIRSKDNKGVENQIDKLNSEGWKIAASKGLTTNYGTIFQKGDQQVILLNDKEILADGAINTAAHEFLHAVLWNTVKNSKGTALALGNDLVKYLKDVNPELMKNSVLVDRLQLYKDDATVTNEQQAEEVLTLFSEAALDGAIELNEGALDQIQGFFTRIFNSLIGREANLTFNSGKDVFKFIKGYNESIKKGKFTTAQNKLLEGRAEGDLIKREYKTKDIKDRDTASKSSQSFDKTNELFSDPDFEATNRFDQKNAVKAAGGVIEAATQRLWRQGSLLTRDQFKKALENEYVQALVEYDSNRDTGTGAGSSISSKFNLRAGGVAKANLGKGESLSLDSEQAKQVADKTEQREFDEVESKENTQRKKVYSSNTNQVGNLDTAETKAIIKEEVSKDILLSANKGNNAADTARVIANEAKQNYFKKLRKDIGTFSSQKYKDFVNSLDKNFIKSLPVSIIKRRFGKLFGIKQTGIAKTKQTSKTGKPSYFNKPVFSVPKVTNEGLQQFKDYFLGGEKRQQSLYNILATDFALESIQELMSDKTFMDKLQTSLGDQGITANEFMQNIENKLDARTVEDTSLDVVKASKKYKTSATIVDLTIENYMSDKGFTTFATKGHYFGHDKFTDDQIKARNESVLLTIPELGLDFYEFTNSKNGKTRSSDSFGASSGRTIFNFNAGNKIDQLKDLLNAALTGEFIKANPEYVKKYTKTIGNDVFLDKAKLKKGSALSTKDITVLKKAESEQGQYAKLSPEKRIKLLRDKKFRDFQADKSKILKKILNVISKNVRTDGKIIPARMEFWASWINSQVNNSKHVMRVLAPIEFFSLSKMPKSTFVEGYKLNKNDEVVSGNPLNYVAEHLMPANNAAKIAVDLIYNNTVNKDFSLIKDNYVQGQLLKTDDVIVGKAGYTSQFPSEFWQMDKPNVWVRYLLGNPNINLNQYVTYKDGKVMTIAESLGLPLDKSLRNPDSINFQNKLLTEILGVYKENNTFVLKEPKSIKNAKAELKDSQIVNQKSSKKVNVNQKTLFNLITPNSTTEASIEAMGNADKTVDLGNKASKKIKGISVFDFDDTLAFSKSMVIVNLSNGTTQKITPAEFASEAELLEENGAEFDFSEFNKVVDGKKGPLADLALKRQDKFGSGDIFVLTARPQASALSIKKFLDGIGLNLPLENITGLENGSPDAKALWVLDKTAKGYNDFYFADDALANVQAVKNILDQVDVKSEVQQAKASKKRNLNKEFNGIIEQQSGKEWFKNYSDSRAKVEGKAKNKFEFFIPPSAEDFTGLLYKILPKGEKGNLAKQWIQDNLLDPFNKAEQLVIKAKIAVANDFQELRKNIKNVPKNLSKQSGYSKFTFSQALRVHIWTMQGMEIPGLSTRDKNALNKLIEQDPALKVFAEKIAFIQKGKQYPGPNTNWVSGSITSDIINGIQKVYRKEALQEWQDNVDIIFSKDNMNKLEAIYGSNFTIALNNMLSRMKSGSNRPVGGNAQVENVMDWLNNSVGAIMFLNVKSGLLQLISSVNFMNWSDNNPLAAGKAFANQKQYWKDVMYLLNSDYLVQRRNGLKINVAESEIAEASKKGGLKGVIAYMLNKGFIFTRIADSLAISTGGSTFYRNRVNSLLKQVNIDTGKLYTKAEAEAIAFNDFYQVSEESQQSSRTDRISMQQASGLGRLVLNFANTPMQYARIIKKSTADLLAGRGDWKTNLSKIFYYGIAQNLIFNAMQAAVFTVLFKEDDDEDKEGRAIDDKARDVGQGMLSSLLRGLGYGGALVDTLIAVSLEVNKQSKKKTPDFEEAVWSVFDYSPAMDSKIRKLRSAAKTYKYNREEIYRRGFNLENPAYLAIGQLISASTNAPADRILRLMMSIKQMGDKDLELWQRAMLAFGYSSWQADLPYWGTKTTLENEEKEDAKIKLQYKNDARKLKTGGYKRRPMTKGVPEGKLNVDYIRVERPTGDYEYWLTPKN